MNGLFAELKRPNVYKIAVAASEKAGARQPRNQFVNLWFAVPLCTLRNA
jgi:hypothetical protein